MNSDAFIKTKDLTKIYSIGTVKVVALDSVNLSIERGRFLGITGTSGSGKSTLVNLLGGLDKPSSGTIKFQNRLISELTKDELTLHRRLQVGMIFQSFNLIGYYTALENVALPLLFTGVAKKQRNARAAEMLKVVGLYHRKDHRPSELSGGEQQRVAVARALINQPIILLADEPTGNLDSNTARQIVQLLADLNAEHGLTVIMISHEEPLLREFANDIIRLHDGRIADKQSDGPNTDENH